MEQIDRIRDAWKSGEKKAMLERMSQPIGMFIGGTGPEEVRLAFEKMVYGPYDRKAQEAKEIIEPIGCFGLIFRIAYKLEGKGYK